MKDRTSQLGYVILDQVEGHRLGDFPHHKYSKERLANLEFHPSSVLWVLELQITPLDRSFGAFYEDVLN